MSRFGAGSRRWLARLALPLGILLLVAAPVLRAWVAPALAQSPAVPATSILTERGTVTTLFDLESGTSGDAEPLVVTRTTTTTGDASSSASPAATALNAAVTTTTQATVLADGRSLGGLTFRLAADRHSQALFDCCDAAVDGVTVPMAGAGSPLRLPWLASGTTYPYFDPTLLRSVEMTDLGADHIDGRRAVKYQQATPATELGSVQVPGRLVGSAQATVSLPRVHSVNRTLWVDPTTGIILRSADRVRETLRDDAGKDVVVLLAMTLGTTPESEATQRALADEQGRPVLWAHSYGPLICWTLGGLLLLLGTVLTVMRARERRAQEDFPDELATFDDLRDTSD